LKYDLKTVPIEHDIKIEKANMNLKKKWNATCKPSMRNPYRRQIFKTVVAASVDKPICVSFKYSTRT